VDESYLKLILDELMVNAVKYSPEDSRITIEFATQANSSGNYLLITLENKAKACSKKGHDGQRIVGIPYEQSELVFDLFYTLDAYPTSIPEERWRDGTGLYIARRILSRFGAAIDVANGLDYTAEIPQPIVRVVVRLPITPGGSL
jgi:signal transduction histidine kinase